MKKELLFLISIFTYLILIPSQNISAQSISYPKVGSQTEEDIDIMDIAWMHDATVIHFAYANTKDYEHYIYLSPPGHKEAMFIEAGGIKYKLKKVEGIATKDKVTFAKHRLIIEFYAYFEKVPYKYKNLNLIEGLSGSWNFYNIALPISGKEAYDNNHFQTVQLSKQNDIFFIPCKANGMPLRFIFDTGASDVSISLEAAVFMLKNGNLQESDIGGKVYYQVASGEIKEGTSVNIKELEIGNRMLYNVQASVLHTLNAPLLLGQSALSKLGRFQFDYSNNILKIFGE